MFGKNTARMSQEIFRVLMDSFAHPGKIYDLGVIRDRNINSDSPAGIFYAMCYTVMDNETKFTVIGSGINDGMIDTIYKLTKSDYVSVNDTDFAVITGGSSRGAIENINRGTSAFPDMGATVFYFVKDLNCETGILLYLNGPGIKDRISFHVDGADLSDLVSIRKINTEFPLGIDVVFYDGNDRIVSVPRSSKITIGE